MRSYLYHLLPACALIASSISVDANSSSTAHQEFAELQDSYTSIFAPCQVTYYDSKQSSSRMALKAKSNDDGQANTCGSLHHRDIISTRDLHVIFWPDPYVGDEPACYRTEDVPDMQEDALSKWHAFGETILDELDDNSTTTTAATLDSTSVAGNVTERIISEFTYPHHTTHFTVDCTRDKILAKDASDAAELAIFVGAAATLSIFVCCCAGFSLLLWCCCCKSPRSESDDWQEVTYAREKGGKHATTIRVETGLVPTEYGTTTYGSTD